MRATSFPHPSSRHFFGKELVRSMRFSLYLKHMVLKATFPVLSSILNFPLPSPSFRFLRARAPSTPQLNLAVVERARRAGRERRTATKFTSAAVSRPLNSTQCFLPLLKKVGERTNRHMVTFDTDDCHISSVHFLLL